MNKNISLKISIISLVVSNAWLLIPLWQRNFVFGDLLLVYWLEIAIIGVLLSLKILIGHVAVGKGWGRLVWAVYALFFIAVLLVTGVITPMFISLIGITYYIPGGVDKSSWLQLIQPQVWQAGYVLFASHFISFLVNFIGQGEYKKWAAQISVSNNDDKEGLDIEAIIGRFFAVFFACVGGGVLALSSYVLGDYIFLPSISATIFASTIFIIIKIILDIRAHLKEHSI